MDLYLCAKFEVSSTILTSFRQGVNPHPHQNEPLKSPHRSGLTRGFELVTRGFEFVTREFEVITRVLPFHIIKLLYLCFLSSNFKFFLAWIFENSKTKR